MSIVLGLLGIFIGGIWIALTSIQSTSKAQAAVKQIHQIVANYRRFYATRGMDLTYLTNITCLGIQNGFLPAEMITPTAKLCTISPSGDANYEGAAGATGPLTPFAGTSGLNIQVDTFDTTASLPDVIRFGYYNITPKDCINLAAAASTDPEIVFEVVGAAGQFVNGYNGSGGAKPFTPAQIAGFCSAVNPSGFAIGYPIR